MTLKKLVLFDIGGVLEVTPEVDWKVPWIQRLNLTRRVFLERLQIVYRGGGTGAVQESDFEKSVAREFKLSPKLCEEFLNDIWEDYLGSPNSELIDFFENLSSRCRTAILSNSFVGARRREQERYGFEDLCERIFYSHELGLLKPDSKIYELVCTEMGVAPNQCFFFDDVEENVQAARRLGMTSQLFQNNSKAKQDIEAFLKP